MVSAVCYTVVRLAFLFGCFGVVVYCWLLLVVCFLLVWVAWSACGYNGVCSVACLLLVITFDWFVLICFVYVYVCWWFKLDALLVRLIVLLTFLLSLFVVVNSFDCVVWVVVLGCFTCVLLLVLFVVDWCLCRLLGCGVCCCSVDCDLLNLSIRLLFGWVSLVD